MKGAPKIAIIDWFAVFLLLFAALLFLQWFVPALVVLAIFSTIFAWYYHTYLDVPRTAEEKLVLSNWWAWLEQRWKESPPAERGLEYYLNKSPYDLTESRAAGAILHLAYIGLLSVFLYVMVLQGIDYYTQSSHDVAIYRILNLLAHTGIIALVASFIYSAVKRAFRSIF